MVVGSGELPYLYLDIPFEYLGRGPGSVGVPWQNMITDIPQPSGYLFEQAMFVQLAEIRKYGEGDYKGHYWWIYKGANLTTVTKEPIYDPTPTGSAIIASGNMNCLNMVQDLRDSLDRIFSVMSTDSVYTSGEIKRDYFQTSFFEFPSGQVGDFQFKISSQPFLFGPLNTDITQYMGGSGYLDSQTIKEISYQPYSRFSKKGTHTIRSADIETAPLFPACIKSNGEFLSPHPDDANLYAGDYSKLGVPQTFGFDPNVLPSGYMRVCGDAFSKNTNLHIVTRHNVSLNCDSVGKRWIGLAETHNLTENHLIETVGMAYMTASPFVGHNFPHGVRKIIVSSSDMGYGRGSGLISIYPNDIDYNVTGWISGLVGTNNDIDVICQQENGQPITGVISAPSGGGIVRQSHGVHVCDQAFGCHNTSGLIVTSPFNGAGLFFHAFNEVNYGGDGSIKDCGFVVIPEGPPYWHAAHWEWYRSYNKPEIKWRGANNFIQPPGDPVAYSYMGTWNTYTRYMWWSAAVPTPCVSWSQYHFTSRRYIFLKYNTQTYDMSSFNSIESVDWYTHSIGFSGLGWSRQHGWFATGGKSVDSHKFEAGFFPGDLDGSFTRGAAGSLELNSPIGIGNYSFVMRGFDRRGGNKIYWNIEFNWSQKYKQYYVVILDSYDVVATDSVPFSTSDLSCPFIGHTMFIGNNNEGITPGDWVVVSAKGQRWICRVVVDDDTKELRLVECLFGINQTARTPDFFMSI